MKPELVIFDCDGVLVDSETIFNEVLVANLARNGLSLTLSECMNLFVGGTMILVKQKATGMGAILSDTWIDDVYAEAFARLRQGVNLVDGIIDVLDQLDHAQIPYCVASNGSTEKMGITLGQTGLVDRFEGRMFSAYEVGIAKPEPGLFLHAAKILGFGQTQCVVIEDSVNGVIAAKRAEMRCWGYAAHDDGAKLAAEDAVIFNEMAALPYLLGV